MIRRNRESGALQRKFDAAKDLVPVGTIARIQMYLVASSDLPAKDTLGLVALAKEKPNKLSYASSCSGTPPHLAGELFAHLADIEVAHLPYKGSAPALQDVLGGHADTSSTPESRCRTFVKARSSCWGSQARRLGQHRIPQVARRRAQTTRGPDPYA